ncbi:MAG TPA: ABC transporter permease [Myxococcaceae bacterium]|nr:ABC transporter permease [Myxococcaceae bacterium]
MIAGILTRLLQGLGVMLVVGLLAFAVSTKLGDPVNNMLGQSATSEEREAMRRELGLDRPFVVQYGRYLGRVTRGQLGVSYRLGIPVGELLAERLPASVELSGVAMLLTLLFGVPMGIYTALRRGSVVSKVILGGSLAGLSVPTFLIGLLLIFLFAVQLQWLPSSGRGQVVSVGPWTTGLLTASGLRSLLLPSITLALYSLALLLRLVRGELLDVLQSDHVRFARARGLPERSIHFRHGLRNALLPVITVAALQLGSLLAFSVVTETVFQWPGMGLLFLQAVQFVDVPVISSYLLLAAVAFVLINLVVDLSYRVLDPRVRSTLGGT